MDYTKPQVRPCSPRLWVLEEDELWTRQNKKVILLNVLKNKTHILNFFLVYFHFKKLLVMPLLKTIDRQLRLRHYSNDSIMKFSSNGMLYITV